jgi:hypothetical protein
METQTDENLGGAHHTNESPTKRKQGRLDEILARLDYAYAKDWIKCQPIVNELLKGKSFDVRTNRAKSLSLYTEVISLRNDTATKFKLSDIHRCLLSFEVDKPKLSRYNKFEEFINRGPGRSLPELTDYMGDKPRGTGNTKIGDGLKTLIYSFYADPRKLNCKRIAELVSHAVRDEVKHNGVEFTIIKWTLPDTETTRKRLLNRDYISASTVKKIITIEIKNTYYRSRYGAKAFHQSQITPLFRKKAQHPLDRVEIDSTVYSFLFRTDGKKFSVKLVTCQVVDCYSGRILGLSFGKTESADLVITAIRNAFNELGYLPAEIFTDQFPGHNSEGIKEFINKIKSLGCRFDLERTGNARAKGLVEVTVNNLCELAKECTNFIGKNITTKSKDSRKSVEFVAKLMKASSQAYTRADIKGQIIELAAYYNSRVPSGKMETRIECFKNRKAENAIEISLENKVWLFHKVLIKNVEQGTIVFRRGYQRFVYVIDKAIDRLRLNGWQVKVRYNETDLEKGEDIWVFDAKTDEFLFTCSPQLSPHVAKINQTETDQEIYKNNRKSKKELVEIVKSKELELDATSAEVANYLISSKVEQTNIEELYILKNMIGDSREANLSSMVFRNDDGEVEAYVPDPHKRFKKEDDGISYDRYEGYEEPPIDDDLEPIMIVNSKR